MTIQIIHPKWYLKPQCGIQIFTQMEMSVYLYYMRLASINLINKNKKVKSGDLYSLLKM